MGVLDAAGRKRPALLGIVIAVAGAIWGVVEVLGGPASYGAPEAVSRLLPIVIAAAVFSVVIGAGARLVERQRSLAPIGYLTILLGLVAFGAAVRLSFHNFFLEENDDLSESLWIAALAAGQVSLLLSWPQRDDRGPAMATAVLASLATAALAIATVVEISASGSNVSDRLFGILMVVYLLGLVLVPLVDLATRRGADGRPGANGY